MRPIATLLNCLPICLAIYTSGQTAPPPLIDTAPPPSDRFPASWYPADDNVTYTLAIEKNLPYAATLVLTDRYVDQSGKVIIHAASTLAARDSAGRSRSELETGGSENEQGEMIPQRTITVSDPVSHCNFRWMEPLVGSEKPRALVNCMPRTLHYINQNPGPVMWAQFLAIASMQAGLPSGSSVSSEPLGKRKFGDAEAEGQRTTSTNTTQKGGVQKRISEMWYSPDIKEVVQLNIDDPDPRDPQSGQTPYMQLTNIKRTEPAPSLFYPPQGFDIQPGQFR